MNFIGDILKQKVYYPALTVAAALDYVLKDEPWWSFEYETVIQELVRAGLPSPTEAILGEIQCISAIRNGKSFIDKEWHLFEKACAALTGIPVLMWEKQNLPIENVIHAMKLMKMMGPFEMSDEVKHYVGCEVINDEIFWYPFPDIDKYLVDALDRIKIPNGYNMDEINTVRDMVKKRFKEYEDVDMEKAVFKETSVEDLMCYRIFASLMKGRDLMRAENEALNTFNNIKDGVMNYVSKGDVETAADIPEDEKKSYDISENIDIVDLDTGDIETFEDGVKTAALDLARQFADITEGFALGTNLFEAFPQIKLAAIPDPEIEIMKYAEANGLPIMTGVPVGNIFPDDPTKFDQEETEPIDKGQPAEEIMMEYVNDNSDSNIDLKEDESVTDPFA